MAVPLHHTSYGSHGPALVLLHGFLGASANLHKMAKSPLGDYCRVFAVDARNHGRSPEAEPFTYEAMAEDVLAFMDVQGLEQAILMGHSMGAKTAMTVAMLEPERVRGLIVVDMAPRAYTPHHGPILDALARVNLAACKTRSDVDDALAHDLPEASLRAFLMQNLERTPEGFGWRIPLDLLQRDYYRVTEALVSGPPYSGPTLFVRGGNSSYIRDEDEDLIYLRFPAADIVTITGASHWVHVDAPDALNRVLENFLRDF